MIAWTVEFDPIPDVPWGMAVETVAVTNDAGTNLVSQPYEILPLVKRGK